jgi:hypothetical protein
MTEWFRHNERMNIGKGVISYSLDHINFYMMLLSSYSHDLPALDRNHAQAVILRTMCARRSVVYTAVY